MAELANPDLDWVYFVEMHPFHKADEEEQPIYIATADVFFDAADPDAPNREYNGIVDVALSVSRSISISNGGVSADAQPDYGGVMAMVDDELADDAVAGVPRWKGCAFDDYPCRVLRGLPPKDGAPWRYASLEVVGNFITLGGNSWGATSITFPIGGLATRLEKDFPSETYAGTGGMEGGSDVKGKVKRRAIGHCLHATPLLIDAGNEWWDVAPVDGFHSDVKVYQGGLEYEQDPSNPPAAGKVYVDMANGRVRTNGMPSYPLTVSFISGFAGGALTKADAIEGILAELDFDPSEIDADTFTAFNTADDSEIQFYVEESTSALAIINALLAPGAFHTEDEGKFQIFQFSPPDAATPEEADLLITDEDLVPGELSPQPDILPASRLDFDHAQCLTSFSVRDVSNGDVVGAALDADRAFVSLKWRTEPYPNPVTAAAHRLAKPERMESCMVSQADAAAEVARLGAMFTVPQEAIDMPIAAAPFALKPHAQVWLQSDFHRINAAFRAITVGSMSRASRVNTMLWRPQP